ncbi:MAG: hypothetical protein Q4C68_05455 [Moraxella sp.]|nr:hypothetical protein [Moraxella sp.]
MKKILIPTLLITLGLTACQKQEEAPVADTQTTQTTTTESAPATTTEPTTQADSAQPATTADAHAGHDHSADEHNHDHAEGDKYQCDNGKSVSIAIHNHEGEMEAYATIDDVAYDLIQEGNDYVSPTESFVQGQTGMKLSLTDGKATFSSLDGATVLASCQKS